MKGLWNAKEADGGWAGVGLNLRAEINEHLRQALYNKVMKRQDMRIAWPLFFWIFTLVIYTN